MAKERSFQAKVAKSQMAPQRQCKVCKEAIVSYHVIQTVKNEVKGSWRFKENYVGVCKCNEKQVLS